MKFIKILTILSLLLTACAAANYANAFEKVGILEDGVYRFSQNGIGVKKRPACKGNLRAKLRELTQKDHLHAKYP